MNFFSFQILSQCTNKMYSKCLGPSFYVAFCPRRVAQVSTILPSFISATHSFFIRIACSSLLLLLMLNPCYVQIISHTRPHLNWKTYMDRPRLKCQDLSETQARKHGRMDGWMEGQEGYHSKNAVTTTHVLDGHLADRFDRCSCFSAVEVTRHQDDI